MEVISKMRLKNKICAVTGAGSGIGLAAAKLFAREGAKVFILEKNVNAGKAAEKAILESRGQACFISCNIACNEEVKAAFDVIQQHAGKLHVLYNNASVYLGGKDGMISKITPAIWQKVIEINLNGLYHCCHYAIPLMLTNNGGSIINTASSAGVVGIPNCDAYTATKGATVALTRSMAAEYGPLGIRVNCIAPAAIMTDMVKQSNPQNSDFDERAFLQLRSPLRRWGTPEEVAGLAVFLASDDASYINGTIIPVDGGITINGDLSKVQ
jgi:NAD(P)-dependent dehydrogenase (short-subunit alcohol dehydrogenase family)